MNSGLCWVISVIELALVFNLDDQYTGVRGPYVIGELNDTGG